MNLNFMVLYTCWCTFFDDWNSDYIINKATSILKF